MARNAPASGLDSEHKQRERRWPRDRSPALQRVHRARGRTRRRARTSRVPTMRLVTVPSANQIAPSHAGASVREAQDAFEEHCRRDTADRAERERAGDRTDERRRARCTTSIGWPPNHWLFQTTKPSRRTSSARKTCAGRSEPAPAERDREQRERSGEREDRDETGPAVEPDRAPLVASAWEAQTDNRAHCASPGSRCLCVARCRMSHTRVHVHRVRSSDHAALRSGLRVRRRYMTKRWGTLLTACVLAVGTAVGRNTRRGRDRPAAAGLAAGVGPAREQGRRGVRRRPA